jgi:hypothetical protein
MGNLAPCRRRRVFCSPQDHVVHELGGCSRLEQQPHVVLDRLVTWLTDRDRVALGIASFTLFGDMARQQVIRPLHAARLGSWSMGRFHLILSSANDLRVCAAHRPTHITLSKDFQFRLTSFGISPYMTHLYLEGGGYIPFHRLILPDTLRHVVFDSNAWNDLNNLLLPASLESFSFFDCYEFYHKYTIWIRDGWTGERMWLLIEDHWTVGGVLHFTLEAWPRWKARNCVLYLGHKILGAGCWDIIKHGVVAGTYLDIVELSDKRARRMKRAGVWPHLRSCVHSTPTSTTQDQTRTHIGPTLAHMTR